MLLSTDASAPSQYREAHEEVGLPRDCPHIHTVCTLRPYIASSKLLVTPVVALLTDTSVLDNLVPAIGEVERIFDHPLEAILEPSLASKENLAAKGSADWVYEDDFHVRALNVHVYARRLLTIHQCTTDIDLPWLANSTYRMHRFRSSAFAIKGLTSDILVGLNFPKAYLGIDVRVHGRSRQRRLPTTRRPPTNDMHQANYAHSRPSSGFSWSRSQCRMLCLALLPRRLRSR